ncbi:MAG: response regulator [Elusimicrobia bacterium]|nr:response regulator [Elusimicrobiota bacterium]
MSQKILVADDEEAVRKLVSRALVAPAYEVVGAEDGAAALEMARTASPDLIILDLSMPRMDGWKVLQELRTGARTRTIPVIMLTGCAQPGTEVEGLESGADDFIAKPFQPDDLRAHVLSALRRSRTDLAASPLTRLPGTPSIEAEVTRRIAEDRHFALHYADLDHFKAYNDHYGFARGDEVIRATAGVIEAALRPLQDAFLGHVGGDDFVFLTRPEDAASASQRIVTVFDQKAVTFYEAVDLARGWVETADRQGRIQRLSLLTLSIGIVSSRQRLMDHYARAVSLAAEMKSYCKARNDGRLSRFAFDRRRDDVH